MAGITIKTFGVLHGEAPREDGPVISVDLTTALRNPANDSAMIEMTGLDVAVHNHVLSTPGADAIIYDTVKQVLATGRDVHVFCQGGRHRSVAVAEHIATCLRGYGITVQVQHRDIDKPVVRKA
jgi:RNase adaptor protein for sRNA GlmZ degradation